MLALAASLPARAECHADPTDASCTTTPRAPTCRVLCTYSAIEALHLDVVDAERDRDVARADVLRAEADLDACRAREAVLAQAPVPVSRWAWLGAGFAAGVATVLAVVWAVR